MRWSQLQHERPELAAFGRERLTGIPSYLATVAEDGSPRVHPVTPVIGAGLFVFMEPTSPKGHDLARGSAYALHAAVADNDGGEGEFLVRGRGSLIDDPHERASIVERTSYDPKPRYVLYELWVHDVLATTYVDGSPVRETWSTSRCQRCGEVVPAYAIGFPGQDTMGAAMRGAYNLGGCVIPSADELVTICNACGLEVPYGELPV